MENLIITHPGKSHFDEFFAISLICAVNEDTKFIIERREPNESELENPDIWVVDIGERYEPELKNFDHHQDLNLGVSFVLVSDYLKLTPVLSELSWWSFKDKIDRFGPVNVGLEFGIDDLSPTHSPVEQWVLSLFEKAPNELLKLLTSFGKTMIKHGRGLSHQLNFWAKCETIKVKGKKVLIGLIDDTSYAEEYIKRMEEPAEIYISYDNRGDGWKMKRYKDHPDVNFSVLENHESIKFAHKGGFIAKTNERISLEELTDLIELSIK